jgi:ArsR family transcriptional regulator
MSAAGLEWKERMESRKMYAAAEVPCCDEKEVHEDKVRFVNENMPAEDALYDLAELFKAFGDTTRIRILFALFEADICVCDLAASLGMTQSAISHQLRLLKQARLVNGRREGKQIVYFLADEHVRTIIQQGMDHIME